VLIEARKCVHCSLIYRWPTDSEAESEAYYNGAYRESRATDIPGEQAMSELLRSDFKDSAFDKRARIAFLESAGATKGRCLDFGCSWGYSVHQYRSSGYDVVGFEVSKARADVGVQRLNLDIRTRWNDVDEAGPYDVIVCDHSMEHVSDLRRWVDRLESVLKPGGKLFVFAPNGSGVLARRYGTGWSPFIGEPHALALTCEWFIKNFPRHRLEPRFHRADGRVVSTHEYLLDDEELTVVAQKQHRAESP
jgi:2-polyprenyl-3-methyl-5-hydroxy-6-metoxy-1,4-benzoquinol methylase